MIEALLAAAGSGPRGLTQQTGAATASPSDLRQGLVAEVTARGITVAVAGGAVVASHLDSYAPAVGDNVAMVKTQDSWLALGRIVGPGTPTNNLSPGSAAGPTVLAGMVTKGTSTLLNTTSTTPVAIPQYSLTFYHPDNHHVLLLAGFSWVPNVSDNWAGINFVETTNVLGTVNIGQWSAPAVSASFGRFDTVSAIADNTNAGFLRTYVMQGSRRTGTGTGVAFNENAASPGYMLAIDIGDNAVIPAL